MLTVKRFSYVRPPVVILAFQPLQVHTDVAASELWSIKPDTLSI
jgi:hypothetical protein